MKKISRRSFLKVAGIGAAALGLAACGGSSASTTTSTASSTAASAGGSDAGFTNTTLTLYSPGGENSVPTKTIIKYGELIEEATGGAVKCDVQYGGTLGNDAEAIESTRMGTIDLIFAGTSGFTSFYDKAKVMDLPFLFTSAEEANEVLNSTDIGEQIFADFGDYDLVYLAEGDNGMRHVSTVKSWGQIEKADDVIGLKIRVPQSQMYTDCWSTLGATPVALALTELTTALSNGTAQAQDNATYHEVANATWDDIGYFSFINYMWMGCTMAANKIAWDKLNETTQNVLREKAKEAAQFSFDCIAEDNVTARKTMEEGGVQFCDNRTSTPSRRSWTSPHTTPVMPARHGMIRAWSIPSTTTAISKTGISRSSLYLQRRRPIFGWACAFFKKGMAT